MQITVTIPAERPYNLLCSAVYGAIAYWADAFDWTPGTEPAPEGIDASPDTCALAPLTNGHWTITSESQEIPGCPRVDRLDRAAIERGLEVMARDCPRHFADLLDENDDAVTADVFVQCCIFGEVVYG